MGRNSRTRRPLLGRLRFSPLVAIGGALLLVLIVGRLAMRTERAAPPQGVPAPTRSPSLSGPNPVDPRAPSAPPAETAPRTAVDAAPAASPSSVPGSSHRPDALTFTVLWDDGTPVADALVAIAIGEEVNQFGRADTSGLLELGPVPTDDARVHILQGGVQVSVTRLSARRGPVHIEIPLRSAIRGVVRIDGEVPIAPIEVGLTPSDATSTAGAPPTFLTEALGWRVGRAGTPRTRTGEKGRFTIAGLAPGWSGSLWPEHPYRLASGKSTLPLSAPVDDVVFELVTPASIRGRILSSTGDPVEGCKIALKIESEGIVYWTDDVTGTDGRFLHPLTEENPKSAILDFSAPGVGFGHAETNVDPSAGADLGEVILEASRGVTFRVLDGQGRPVAGASAGWSSSSSHPSDSEGLCTIDPVPTARSEIEFFALSYYPASVTIPAQASPSEEPEEAPIEVRIRRMSSLELQFQNPDGTPVPGVRLSLQGRPLFEPESHVPFGSQEALGATMVSKWSSDRGHGRSTVTATVVEADEAGRILLPGIQPGTPIHLQAKDTTGADLGWEQTVEFLPGETLRITASLREEPTILRAYVVGEDGQALSDASIQWPGRGTPPFRAETTGQFEIGPLTGDRVDLLIEAPGYAPRFLPGVSISEPQEIELERGREHFVFVADAEGHAHRPMSVLAVEGGTMLAAGTERPDGSFRFEHLPSGPVTFRAIVLGKSFTARAWDGPETILEIPTPGSLLVRWNLPEELPVPAAVSLHQASDPKFQQGRWISAKQHRQGRLLFPSVLPGSYEVELFSVPEDSKEQIAPRETVEVQTGETAEVTLRQQR